MQKSKLKKITLITVIVLLILAIMPASAFGLQYVALGDSIAYGLSDIENFQVRGYADQYADKLGLAEGTNYFNLAWPGDTSSSLLDDVRSSGNSGILRSTNIFTISIGSNNLLGPAIQAILQLYSIDMSNPIYANDLDGRLMLLDLAAKVQADWNDEGITPVQRFSRLTDQYRLEAISLNANWAAGTTFFAIHWPIIMIRLRLLNRKAKVYVNNLYNPLLPAVASNSYTTLNMKSLSDRLQRNMNSINSTITKYARLYNYRVINVGGAFASAAYSSPATTPLTFSIPHAIKVAELNKGVQLNPEDLDNWYWQFFAACDPHPTSAGHNMILNLLP